MGFGVGKMTKKKSAQAHQRYMEGQGLKGSRGGVGVSKSNIHWFVLGTKQRHMKRSRYVRAIDAQTRSTGRLDSVFEAIVPRAAQSSTADMVTAAQKRANDVLVKEAKKRV